MVKRLDIKLLFTLVWRPISFCDDPLFYPWIVAEVLTQNRVRWRFTADLLKYLTEHALPLPFNTGMSQD